MINRHPVEMCACGRQTASNIDLGHPACELCRAEQLGMSEQSHSGCGAQVDDLADVEVEPYRPTIGRWLDSRRR